SLGETRPNKAFQSSSNPKVGCYGWGDILQDAIVPVSILIQPEGWMLLAHLSYAVTSRLFQSSSNPKVGCYTWPAKRHKTSSEFQSSSNPKVGCYGSKFYRTPH